MMMKKPMNSTTAGPAPAEPLAQLSDEELVLEYRAAGAEGVFAELVRRYERELYSYLRRYLGNAAMAEDAFQATFLQVHLKIEQFEEGRKFRPWLYTIATNQAIDAQRRNRRHRLVSLDRSNKRDNQDEIGSLLDLMESRDPNPTFQMESAERQEWMRAALEKLPEPLYTVVTLVYYQGLKYREAADVLSIPVGTVKSRLHAAILKLNEAWLASHPTADE